MPDFHFDNYSRKVYIVYEGKYEPAIQTVDHRHQTLDLGREIKGLISYIEKSDV